MIFAFGTLYFWLLLLAAIAFIIYSIESEWGGTGATVTMVVTFCLLYFLGEKDHVGTVFSFILDHPGMTLAMMFGYLVFGVLWSVRKWYLYVKRKKDRSLKSIKQGDTYDLVSKSSLDVAYHRGRIISWMCYWPFSLTWMLINDPIREVYKFAFEKVRRIYEGIAERAVRDVEEAKATKENKKSS